MNRTVTRIALLALSAGTAAAAPKAYLSSLDGNVYRLADGQAQLVAAVGFAPAAIAATSEHLLVTDSLGQVLRIDPATGATLDTYPVWDGVSGAAITATDDDLFVADASGNIARLDADGHEVDTYYAGMQVSAMLIDGSNLVIGSPNTLILTAPFGDPNFQFISGCGGIVNSLVLTDTHLFAGDANGTVYRFGAAGGNYETTFETSTDAKGVALLADQLLVLGSDGTLELRDPLTGQLAETNELGVPVSGVVVADFACAADVFPDGALTLDDVAAFVAAFSSGDLAADLDASADLTIDDVTLFAQSFSAGCP